MIIGIAREKWASADWVAYIEGWSFERLGYPKPPPGAHGPEKRAGAARIIEAMPERLRVGVAADAIGQLTDADRAGLFFDVGRIDARAA